MRRKIHREQFEDNKGGRKLKKDRQCNDLKTGLQNTTRNIKATWTPQHPWGLGCCGRVSSSCSSSGTYRVTLVKSRERWKVGIVFHKTTTIINHRNIYHTFQKVHVVQLAEIVNIKWCNWENSSKWYTEAI
jgi:hypothetical protein